MTINERILLKIKESGLTSEEIKQKSGIDKSTISRWRGGHYKPSIDAIVALSQLLDVSSDYLLFGSSSSNIEKSDLENSISVDEQNLIDIYRDIDDTGKREIQRCIREIWSVHKTEKKDVSSDSILENKIGWFFYAVSVI